MNPIATSRYGFGTKLVRLALLLMLVPLTIGCDDTLIKKSLPAPLRDDVDHYSMVGRAIRLWGGDNFEFGKVNELHYIVIRGVDTPKPGQPYFAIARNHANRLMLKRKVRIEVYGHDSMKREIADVFVVNEDPADLTGDTSVGLELIRMGYGWYDGCEFEGAEAFKQAELDAREKKIGLWEAENPVAPWDFERTQQEQRESALLGESSER